MINAKLRILHPDRIKVFHPFHSTHHSNGDIARQRNKMLQLHIATFVQAKLYRFIHYRVQPRYMQKWVIALLLFPNDDFIEFSCHATNCIRKMTIAVSLRPKITRISAVPLDVLQLSFDGKETATIHKSGCCCISHFGYST